MLHIFIIYIYIFLDIHPPQQRKKKLVFNQTNTIAAPCAFHTQTYGRSSFHMPYPYMYVMYIISHHLTVIEASKRTQHQAGNDGGGGVVRGAKKVYIEKNLLIYLPARTIYLYCDK